MQSSILKYLVNECDNHVYKMPHHKRFYKNTVNDEKKKYNSFQIF